MRRQRKIQASVLASMLALAALLGVPVAAPAQQSSIPANLVPLSNGKLAPAAGYDWVTSDVNDLRVKWIPGKRHPNFPNTLAALKEGTWAPAPGFRWANDNPRDLRTVPGAAMVAPAPAPVAAAGPSDEDIGKAVLKAIGAFALHKSAEPQRGDGIAENILRGLARQGRDELLESALKDLFPASQAIERTAIRQLAVLALDGRLDRDRDRVIAQLRQANPDLANVVQIAEFLIRLAHESERRR